MTSPWSDNEDLTAALMYARTTALITALQALLADTGPITSGILTAARTPNGATISSQKGRVIGNRAFLRVTYTVGSADVTAIGSIGTTGTVTNTSIFTIDDARFQAAGAFVNQTLLQGSAGRICTHAVVTADNTIKLCSVTTPSVAISAGDTFSFSGSYLLD